MEPLKESSGMVCLFLCVPDLPISYVARYIIEDVCNVNGYTLIDLDRNDTYTKKIILRYNITALPSYTFLKDGELLYTGYGVQSKKTIESFFKGKG